ncbi:AAA family ATPase [Paenibacillus alkalitolerans]|uniref:AAA family ATPase n=1 Tax=Paenibacillus alkalitolerans TaxID=2799335 RepID=UPI0018F56412|nr:hypothetical protein [Paenibacillus alkalitolerans]
MQESKLIMIEGIPGSGKSTMAQSVSRTLKRQGIVYKWWYEEEKGHPVYIYDDYNTMGAVIEELNGGNYRLVIEKALDQWREFSRSVQASNEIVIVDSCLYGYLTWTLFPYNVPRYEILAYVEEVTRIIAICNPSLIYLYQKNISTALQKICSRRGGDTEGRFIRSAVESTYGRANALSGFDGMVAYWEAYRDITDEAYKQYPFRKMALDNTDGDWSTYNREVHKFLGLEIADEHEAPHNQERFSGRYVNETGGDRFCTVIHEEGRLLVEGLPHAWPRAPILQAFGLTFDVESLPFQITFEADPSTGKIIRFFIHGPELLEGSVNGIFRKEPITDQTMR